MSLSLTSISLVGGTLALSVVGVALAQVAAPPAGMTASQPSTVIGVSPRAAASAVQQAVPRSDVGTVVRTGPSAADKARAITKPPGASAPYLPATVAHPASSPASR